ncbi:hypothetical protein ABPG72_019403 [Tetrahymena utriculariae]
MQPQQQNMQMNPNYLTLQIYDQMELQPNRLVLFKTIKINLQLIEQFQSNPDYYNGIINNFLKFVHILRYSSYFYSIIQQLIQIIQQQQIQCQNAEIQQICQQIHYIIQYTNHPFCTFYNYFIGNVQNQLAILELVNSMFGTINYQEGADFQYLDAQQININFNNPRTQILYYMDSNDIYYLLVKHSTDIINSLELQFLHENPQNTEDFLADLMG